jgi:hypothetical protein
MGTIPNIRRKKEMKIPSFRGTAAALTLAIALAPLACGDDDSNGPEVFSEPFSVEITTQFGTVMASGTRALTTATVFLGSGSSEVVEFVFLNEDGSLVEPLSGEFLEIQISDENIATWTPDQNGGFTGTLRGLAPGSTPLVVRYLYGVVNNSNAQASFVSSPLQVTVP